MGIVLSYYEILKFIVFIMHMVDHNLHKLAPHRFRLLWQTWIHGTLNFLLPLLPVEMPSSALQHSACLNS
jgi:hypothetical protein